MGEGKMTTLEPNTRFREHDIEFLQKRTKLWLEAVLGETYGEHSLAELIADGNLLYRVSKYITREVTGASPGPQEISPKTFKEVTAYGKNSGKYLPYANVDTFLKTCRKVGLTDVELFTPPDAVEGKDIRRVCTSIRSLARKARAQRLRVPDFEDVNRPLPKRKEKVGEIKENLQHSSSSPIASTAATPEADIQKSERVQIISRFLSATNPSPPGVSEGEDTIARPPSDGSSPVTPDTLKIRSFNNATWNSPSTPNATIGGIGTPALTKSLSVMEPLVNSSKSGFVSAPETKSSDEPNPPEKVPKTPSLSSAQSMSNQSNTPPLSYSQKGLGSFRHAQPHFIKKSSQSYLPDSSGDLADEVVTPEPEQEKTPSTPVVSANHLGNQKESSALSGAYRHAQPHFSFKKSSEADLSDSAPQSQDLQSKFLEAQPEAGAPKDCLGKPKAPSSNKIVENDPRSKKSQPEMPVKTSSKPVTKTSQGREKKPSSKPDDTKAPGIQLNLRMWMPLVAGALAFLGTLLVVRTRNPGEYEVQQGDTLSKISKQVGKNSWDELVKLNPNITNPNLIYPTERLKLPMERAKHLSS